MLYCVSWFSLKAMLPFPLESTCISYLLKTYLENAIWILLQNPVTEQKPMFWGQIECAFTVPDKDWFNHFFKAYSDEESIFFPALIPNYL